ncbi:uncharacterized protein JCM6883_005993 [Sporobolomyces salmoneus]|uniref:uncharacterized protein n=1 Tax=Sporobolomyces salmoneus TaxID=183962 RepID=UPI00316ED96A
MSSSSPEATPPPLVAPFSEITTALIPHLPSPSTAPEDLSRLQQAIKSTHEWSTKLSSITTTPDPETIDDFCNFLSTEFFEFQVNSSSSFDPPSSSTNPDTSLPHGPRPRSPEGTRIAAMVQVVKELLTGLNERASEDGGDWWYRVAIALGEGLIYHLEENTVGDRKPADLAYRTYLCSTTAAALVKAIVPEASELPKSSADDLGGLGRNSLEMAAKYSAFDVLGEMLSKNESNKALLRYLFPPDYLGSILHAGWDYHLSHLTFELAFRLLPSAKNSPRDRKDFLQQLFSEDVFGRGPENLAKNLRKTLDKLEVSTGWEEGYQKILKEISMLHIRRSQHFELRSMTYDSKQLLLPADRGSESFDSQGEPSLSQIVNERFYDSKLFWISRHVLAATIMDRKEDYEEDEERMVIPLEGVKKVFVHDLDTVEGSNETNFDCFRVTFLIDAAFPLTLGSKPLSSEAFHVGKRIVPLTETQDFEYKAAGTEVPKYHRLVVLIKKTPLMPKILHETLLDRGKRYPPLLEELSDFPKTSASRPRPPRHAQPAAPAIAPPAQSIATTTSAAIAPVDQTAPRDEDEQERERRVSFAPTPTDAQSDRKQKVSSPHEPQEGAYFLGETPEETERNKVESSKKKDVEEEKEASQEALRKKREQIQSIADELERGSSEGGQETRVGGKVEKERIAAGGGGGGARSPRQQVKSPQRLSDKPVTAPAEVTKKTPSTRPQQVTPKSKKEEKKTVPSKRGDESSELSEPESEQDKQLDKDKEGKSRVPEKPTTTKGGGGAIEGGQAQTSPELQDLPPRPAKKVTTSYSRHSRTSSTKKKTPTKDDTDDLAMEEVTRSESPEVPKKVVPTPARQPKVATKKKVAAPPLPPPKPQKRTRSSPLSKGGGGKEEDSSENEESGGSSSESDLPAPKDVGRGKKGPVKKVAPPAAASKKSTKPPPPKRRKTATSTSTAAEKDKESDETDYEAYPSLEQKKKAPPVTAKKYGKGKKSPAKKIVGGTRKAVKGKTTRGSKKQAVESAQEEQSEEEEDIEAPNVIAKMRPKRAAATKKKVVTDVSSDEEEEEEEEIEEAIEKPKGKGVGAGKRVAKSSKVETKEKKVVSRSASVSVASPVPVPKEKTISKHKAPESTPPPFDVKVPQKPRAPPSIPETTSTQPKKSFQELVQEPAVDVDDSFDIAEGAEGDDFGGFDGGFYQEQEQEQAEGEAERIQPKSPQAQPQAIAPSLSPVGHPSTTDASFADRAFPQSEDRQVDRDKTRTKSKVLVDETPEASQEQRVEHQQQQQAEEDATDGALYLGAHRIGSQLGEFESTGQDVEMEDGEGDYLGSEEEAGDEWESDYDAGAEVEAEERAEVEKQEEFVELADDSEVHFDPAFLEPIAEQYTQEAREESNIKRQPPPPQPVEFSNQGHPSATQSRAQVQRPQVEPRIRPVEGTRPFQPLKGPTQASRFSFGALSRPVAPVGVQARPPSRQPAQSRTATATKSQATRVAQPTFAHRVQPSLQRQHVPSTSKAPRQSSNATASTSRPPQKRSAQPTQPQSQGRAPPARPLQHEPRQAEVPGRYREYNEDAQQLYGSLTEFAGLMADKHQERQLERDDHLAEAKLRFEEPLVDYLNDTLNETRALIDSARSLSITGITPGSNDTESPTQKLIAAASSVMEESDLLWNNLQKRLDGMDATQGETSWLDPIGGGGGGGGGGAVGPR